MLTLFTSLVAWLKFHKTLTSYALVFAMGIGAHSAGSYVWNRVHPVVPTVITNEVTHTTTVLVPGPVTTKTINQLVYVTDKKNATALLKENQDLQVQVSQLNETLAQSSSHGAGPVEPQPLITAPVGTSLNASVHFKDWRLDFTSDGKQAQYDLSQKFEVLSTTGRTKQGQPLSIVKLFEVGPGDKKTEIPSKTTSVVTDDTLPHWFVSPAVQAGFMIGKQGTPAATTKGGIVGLQWLKKGRTKAAEDTSFAVATPVFAFGTSKEIGVLPVSINLGRIPHQPFNNLWVSPYFGTDNPAARKINTFGFAITASF